jgi:F-type H+-transporting ATPase subunit delta
MKVSELAHRYAKAIYELAEESGAQEQIFSNLRELEQAFEKEPVIKDFLTNPMVEPDARVAALEKALAGKGVTKQAQDLLILLARKDRFGLFKEIVAAYEAQTDNANGVCRGTVRSATALDPSERQRVEATVEKVLKKKVIMTYGVDPTVIGGLVAQVGSYTFDDSIAFHLRRMNEELKRRTV